VYKMFRYVARQYLEHSTVDSCPPNDTSGRKGHAFHKGASVLTKSTSKGRDVFKFVN